MDILLSRTSSTVDTCGPFHCPVGLGWKDDVCFQPRSTHVTSSLWLGAGGTNSVYLELVTRFSKPSLSCNEDFIHFQRNE